MVLKNGVCVLVSPFPYKLRIKTPPLVDQTGAVQPTVETTEGGTKHLLPIVPVEKLWGPEDLGAHLQMPSDGVAGMYVLIFFFDIQMTKGALFWRVDLQK